MFRVISSAAQATKPNSSFKASKLQNSGNSKTQTNAGGGDLIGRRPSFLTNAKEKSVQRRGSIC